jgi:hypothetical protein
MLLIKDKIFNKVNKNFTTVSSGSLAEGLDLPGSDEDIMFIINGAKVIQDVQHMNRSPICTTLLMEEGMEFPGFSRLKLIADGDLQCIFTPPECFVETTNGLFLSTILFISKLLEISSTLKNSVHGPCLSNKNEFVDMAVYFHLYSWPRQAEHFIYRHRPGQWPPDILINDIINYGCILVPIGPKEIENNELLWRISFSMAEKQLSHAMN